MDYVTIYISTGHKITVDLADVYESKHPLDCEHAVAGEWYINPDHIVMMRAATPAEIKGLLGQKETQ